MVRLVFMLCLALLVGACKSDPEPRPRGQIMVVLQTDMSLPKDYDRIHLQVSVRGELRHSQTYAVPPSGKTRLPATFAIVASDEPALPVEVQVTGIQGDEARVFAKVVTTVPRERVVTLEVPIQWLCEDSVTELDDGVYVSNCSPENGEDRACRAGTCQSTKVNSKDLPDYKPRDVFGGGDKPADPKGVCFNTEQCFDQGFDVLPDADCVVEVELGESLELNLGLVMDQERTEDGICGENGCYIPLDRSELFGWYELDSDDPLEASRADLRQLRAQLPKSVCEKLDLGLIGSVRASTACQTKTSKYPACGPWSSVDGISLTPGGTSSVLDAGVGDNDAAAGPGADAGEGGVEAQVPSDSPVIAIESEADNIVVFESVQLTLTATADGESVDVTALAAWSSSDGDVATVNANGFVTGVNPGEVVITAEFEGESVDYAIVVGDEPPVDIVLATAPVTLALGRTFQLSATGLFAGDRQADITDQASWRTTDPDVLQVVAGLLTAVGEGTAQISASFRGVTSDVALVEVAPKELDSLRITQVQGPSSAPSNGLTVYLAAIGIYSDGSEEDLSSEVTWSTSDEEVVTVSQGGVATAEAVGMGEVIATLNGLEARVPFTVTEQLIGDAGVPPMLVDAGESAAEAGIQEPAVEPDAPGGASAAGGAGGAMAAPPAGAPGVAGAGGATGTAGGAGAAAN
jgi:hypothetical protein